jgi:hypothetical protein
MPSKYDKILPSLPKLLAEDAEQPDYQKKVNFTKDQLRAAIKVGLSAEMMPVSLRDDEPLVTSVDDPEPTGTELAAVYAAYRYEKARLDALLKNVQLHITALEQMLDDSQERGASGWGDYGASDATVKLLTGESINVQHEPYAQVTDRDEVRLWAVASGLERSLALPWQTLNTHMKELLMLGEPLPKGVTVWSRTKISFRKA